MRLKPSGRDLRLDSRKRGDGVATPELNIREKMNILFKSLFPNFC